MMFSWEFLRKIWARSQLWWRYVFYHWLISLFYHCSYCVIKKWVIVFSSVCSEICKFCISDPYALSLLICVSVIVQTYHASKMSLLPVNIFHRSLTYVSHVFIFESNPLFFYFWIKIIIYLAFMSGLYCLTKINMKHVFHARISFHQFALKFLTQFFICVFDSMFVTFIFLVFGFSQMHAVCQNWTPISW